MQKETPPAAPTQVAMRMPQTSTEITQYNQVVYAISLGLLDLDTDTRFISKVKDLVNSAPLEMRDIRFSDLLAAYNEDNHDLEAAIYASALAHGNSTLATLAVNSLETFVINGETYYTWFSAPHYLDSYPKEGEMVNWANSDAPFCISRMEMTGENEYAWYAMDFDNAEYTLVNSGSEQPFWEISGSDVPDDLIKRKLYCLGQVRLCTLGGNGALCAKVNKDGSGYVHIADCPGGPSGNGN